MAFLVPLVFSSWLELHHDVYYLVYFITTIGMLGAYIRASDVSLTEVIGRNQAFSLALGVASGAFVTWSVLGRIDRTPHPSGNYFVFEIAWRGVVYGVIDASLLSAFPGLIARELMQRNVARMAQAHRLWGTDVGSCHDHHGDVPRRVQGLAERPRHCATRDRQQHHLCPDDCVGESGRVAAGPPIYAPCGGHTFVREQRPSTSTSVRRFGQVGPRGRQ
jgi:hypothetical protein